MINELIGKGATEANKGLNPAKKTADDLKDLLAGPKRDPLDIEKEKAAFIRGADLTTADGAPAKVPVAPADATASGPVPASTIDLPRTIEFIHFGRVHHDAARTFDAGAAPSAGSPTNDTNALADGVDPGRALYYRAAIEREAILLAALAKAVTTALADKEKSEGALGDLAKAAIDIVGGFGGKATAAESSDMKPFLEKIEKAWDGVNTSDIAYADLHDAGIKLHEVRANLASYLLKQVGKPKTPPPDAPAGLLSKVPVLGDLSLPGPFGDIVGMFKKVSGKLHDVSDSLIFGLTLAMQPAIEGTCHDISLETISNRKPLVYPVWFDSEQVAPPDKKSAPLAHMHADDPLTGDLKKIDALQSVNQGVHDFVDDRNKNINDATAKPMEIIDFLSKDVKPAPGNRYLDKAFQAQTGAAGALGGSEKLGEIAITAFYSACAESVPSFMQGFVESMLEYVFGVCVEFLRAVYRVLCALPVTATVNPDELAAAGSTHILTHLVDFATSKLGLDDFISGDNHKLKIPDRPPYLPSGIDWPAGKLSLAPIVDAAKKELLDRASPYLKPVVDYAMAGLATRLNQQRAWAGGPAMTMEAHLGQLPTELALLFRNLIKPLWDLLTDTIEGAVKDGVAKVMGPAASYLGIAGGALGSASGLIGNLQKKAQEAQTYAKNVEDAANTLINTLTNPMAISTSNQGIIKQLAGQKQALQNALGANMFSADSPSDGGPDPIIAVLSMFPANRVPLGKGTKIADTKLPNDQWDDARAEDATSDGAAKTGGGAP